MKINKQTAKLVDEFFKSKQPGAKSLTDPGYSSLIKDTGMSPRRLGLMLDIAYDTMLAYSCGRSRIPPEVAERLNGIIKTLKGRPNSKQPELSDEEQLQKMQEIADAAVPPEVKALMQATGLSEKAVLKSLSTNKIIYIGYTEQIRLKTIMALANCTSPRNETSSFSYLT